MSAKISAYLEEVEKRCEAATPGPWWVEDDRVPGNELPWRSSGHIWSGREFALTHVAKVACDGLGADSPKDRIEEFEANAALIAASRTDVPKLAAALRVAVGEMKRSSGILNEVKYECEASVYTLTDDEMGDVFHARDSLDIALAEIERILAGGK